MSPTKETRERHCTYLDLLRRRLSPEKVLPLVRYEVRMRSLEKQVVFLRACHDCNLDTFRMAMCSGDEEVECVILQT